MSEILSAPEQRALAEHETVIERGIRTFYEVGTALADIRDRKLYRASYGTFEQYAEQRWQMSRPRAYELIAAAEVVSGMPDTAPKPSNARQAVELAHVPEPQRAEVWAQTVERTGGNPTAAAVRETYEARKPAPSKPRTDIPRTVNSALVQIDTARRALDQLTRGQLAHQSEEARRAWTANLSESVEALGEFLTNLSPEG